MVTKTLDRQYLSINLFSFLLRKLKYFPNGCKDASKGFVSLFLCQESSVETNFVAKYSFSILNKSAQKTNLKLVERDGKQFEVGYGVHSFISHEDLEENIDDDMITIVCKVSFSLILIFSGD